MTNTILLNEESILKGMAVINSREHGRVTELMAKKYLSQTKKNDFIEQLFTGTDGRIEIEYEPELPTEEDRVHRVLDILYNQYCTTGCPEDQAYEVLRGGMISKIEGINDKGQVLSRNKKSPYHKMKLNKFLIQYLHYSDFSNRGQKIIEKVQNNLGSVLSPTSVGYIKSDQKEKVTISIRLDDFYSMSLGNSWSSCQTPDGEYSSGAPAWFTGKDSIIAYTKADEDEYTKVWRSLAAVNEKALIIGKHYPGTDDGMNSIISEFLSEKMKSYNEDGLGFSKADERIFIAGEVSIGYNDMSRHAEYNTNYLIDGSEVPSRLEMSMQEFGVCEECGFSCESIGEEEHVCSSCYCYSCGDRLDGGEEQHKIHSGDYECNTYCSWCFEREEPVYSESEGKFIFREDAKPVYDDEDLDEDGCPLDDAEPLDWTFE